MKKKSIIILATVVAVCAIGLLASYLFSWPVNSDSTSGNIGKSSRFSRKTATERIDNMEELLRADEDYKNSILLAYSVMQARAIQFGNLVDMSNQVAGDIPEFKKVLDDMNEQAPIFTNVANALVEAGNNLNTVIGGMPCPDVTQSTINASLSYTTLQKQNYLANRFIDTTDKYIKKAEASEELMLVRDLWLEYQQMTAALEGDEKAAKALDKKGVLLTPEQALKAADTFETVNQAGIIISENTLVGLLPIDVFYIPFRNSFDISNETLGSSVHPSEKEYFSGRIDRFNEGVDQLIQNSLNKPDLFISASPIIISNTDPAEVCTQLNQVITQTAEGNVETLNLSGPKINP
jgi:hypothetical protein